MTMPINELIDDRYDTEEEALYFRPSTFTEGLDASFDAHLYNYNVNSESMALEEMTDERNRIFFEKTGQDIYEAAAASLPPEEARRLTNLTPDFMQLKSC